MYLTNDFFIIFFACIKFWESFFTSKEKEGPKYHGDWTLLVTSVFYFVTCLSVVIEFFFFNKGYNYYLMAVGAVIFIGAILLRRWSIKTLGDQWAIHAIGESKLVERPKLITHGPYKYIRHPIYLSYVMDLVGMIFIFNTLYSVILVFILNIPSYMSRVKHEEDAAIKRMGDSYVEYRKKTSSIFPFL